MYAFQWHLDIPFGQQKIVLDILRQWSETLASTPNAPRSRGRRLLVGHLGESASHVIHEHLFDSSDDWERVFKLTARGASQSFAEEIMPYVVPGSQRWIVYKIVE